jgi:hypothetical protein
VSMSMCHRSSMCVNDNHNRRGREGSLCVEWKSTTYALTQKEKHEGRKIGKEIQQASKGD